MRPGLLLPLLFLAALAAPESRGDPPGRGRVTTVQLPRGTKLADAALADVDGDGGRDLILATSRRRVDFDREIKVRRRGPGEYCFGTEPSARIPLPRDVVAFSAGDVGAAPGEEIVLFTPRGAWAVRPGAEAEGRFRKLMTGDFLWQIPDPHAVFHWRGGVRDLDGDGLPDLLFPEATGYRIAFQRRPPGKAPSFDLVSRLVLPGGGEEEAGSAAEEKGRARDRLRDLRRTLVLEGGLGEETGAALSVWDSVPNPVVADFDGDGLPDVLAQTAEELLVWRQHPRGRFSGAPDLRLLLPLSVDRSRRFDLSFASFAVDLDGDHRADGVILAGDRRSREARTQVLVYVQGRGRGRSAQTPAAPLYGPRGIPQQLLLLRGFSGASDLTDVDGNGLPDLVLGTLRIDAVDALRAASAGAVEARLSVFLNRGGRFTERPGLSVPVKIPVDDLTQAGRRLTARFIGDVNGDGVKDLLLRDPPERLRILTPRRAGRGLVISPRPVFQVAVDRRARIVSAADPGGGPPELLVIERKQVLHVRFR